ncbi:hypothetical protein ACFLRN_10520, partial [Thermoproteota archaeon]
STFYTAKSNGWHHAFLGMISNFQKIYDRLYFESESANCYDFPYIYSPKFILNLFNEFELMPFSSKTRIAFTFSSFFDFMYHKYLIAQRSISFEMPKKLNGPINGIIQKVRGWSGDRKEFV